jgi:nitrite reductase/ring-hydroxylating ferredoxin subunit
MKAKKRRLFSLPVGEVARDALRRGTPLVLGLPETILVDEFFEADSVIVRLLRTRDESGPPVLVAFANVCRHLPIGLDVGMESDEIEKGIRLAPLAENGHDLLCHRHGARFRPLDGMCVFGPCEGLSLFPARAQLQAEAVAVEIDTVDPDAAG